MGTVAWFQRICGLLIIAAVVFVAASALRHPDLGVLTPVCIGEVVSIRAFGASWLSWAAGTCGRRVIPAHPRPQQKPGSGRAFVDSADVPEVVGPFVLGPSVGGADEQPPVPLDVMRAGAGEAGLSGSEEYVLLQHRR